MSAPPSPNGIQSGVPDILQPAPASSAEPSIRSTDAPSSLVAACYASLTTTPLNHAHLEQLPQHVLVQLLTKAVADRDQANAVRQQQQQELDKVAQDKRTQYSIDPPIVMDRVGDDMYKRVEAVTAKWTPRRNYSDFTAQESINNFYFHSKCNLLYNTKSKTFMLKPGWGEADDRPIYMVMSSALLLYRVCCLFGELHVQVNGPEGYKVVWEAEVQHVATGEAVGFTEWKGGILFRVSNLDGPAPFLPDMLELLDLLADEKCPHPYDGTVAGTVA